MQKLLISVYKNTKLSGFLSLCSHIISIVCVIAFTVTIGYNVYLGKYITAVTLAVCAGVGFVLVGIARKLINAPRPYELYSFYEVKPKERNGCSFPSRHAYSAAVISTLSLSVSVWLCIPLSILTVFMCVCRALVGIHFIRDLLAGLLIGAVAGVIGILLI